MDKGYIENGFIVDVSNAHKTSEIIYELSRILDLPDAQSKKVCLKLGSVDLTTTELTSIKALVESMNSEIEFITTASDYTVKSAEELDIKVSELENKVPMPEFNADQEKVNQELERALDKINLTTEESLVAIRFIRANAKEDYENEKFESVNSENKKIATKATSFIAFNSAIMQGMTYTCILGILIVGTNISLTNHDANMIINMGSFLSYVSQLLASLNMISNVFMTFSRSEASKERIKEVFEQTSEIKDRGKEEIP